MEKPYFASVQAYASRFTDAAFWQPYIEEVCRRHDLDHRAGTHSSLPGSHPVFLVGGRYVVKFFSDLFGGERSFPIEREIFKLVAQIPAFPTSQLVAEGSLFPLDNGWHWPYLVSTQLPGVSLVEAYDQISMQERERIAEYLGHWLQRLHHVSLDDATVLRPDWTPFCNWLAGQRAACVENHRRWQSLPMHLLDQLDDYLPDIETLVDRSRQPLLLHCDLNADHLLGDLSDGHWTSSGIIDFGDAWVGDFFYELAALHLGLFRYDKHLLRIFLQAYDFNADQQSDFTARALSFTLLHEFNVLESVSQFAPNLEHIATLTELAEQIWQPTSSPLSIHST